MNDDAASCTISIRGWGWGDPALVKGLCRLTRARPAARSESAQEPAGELDIARVLLGFRALQFLVEQPPDPRVERRLAPAVAGGGFRQLHLAVPRGLEQGERGGGV